MSTTWAPVGTGLVFPLVVFVSSWCPWRPCLYVDDVQIEMGRAEGVTLCCCFCLRGALSILYQNLLVFFFFYHLLRRCKTHLNVEHKSSSSSSSSSSFFSSFFRLSPPPRCWCCSPLEMGHDFRGSCLKRRKGGGEDKELMMLHVVLSAAYYT